MPGDSRGSDRSRNVHETPDNSVAPHLEVKSRKWAGGCTDERPVLGWRTTH